MSEAKSAPALHRVLGPVGISLLTLSVLSPAASVFVTGSDLLRQVGGWTALAFLLGGALTLVFTAAQAELGSAFPTAGGDYATVGRTLGPRAGFVFFGLNLLGAPVFAAITATGISLYLRAVLPGLQPAPTALVLLAVATALAALNIRVNAIITGIFLGVELSALAVLAVLGFAHPVQGLGQALFVPGPALPLGALAAAVAAGSWATSGAGQAIYFSEELRDPARVGRLVMIVNLIAVVTMVVPVVGVVIGTADFSVLGRSPSPFTAFVATSGAPWLATLLGLCVAAAILNAAIAGVACYGRFLYSSGRDAIWPAPVNTALMTIHPRFGSPWVATLVMGAAGMAWCFASLNILIIVASANGIVMWILLNWAGIVGRRRGLSGQPGQYGAPLYPLTHIISFAAAAGLAVLGWQDRDTGRPGELIVVAVIAAALLYHQFVLSRRPGGWRMAVLPA